MMDRGMIERIEKALAGPYCGLKLRADGHELTVEVRRISSKSMRYACCLFVDGYIRGENLKPESDIGAKFYPLRTRQLMSDKAYLAHRKQFGKRAEADFRKRTQYQYREAHFRSGRALALHLKKHCKAVEIIDDRVALL